MKKRGTVYVHNITNAEISVAGGLGSTPVIAYKRFKPGFDDLKVALVSGEPSASAGAKSSASAQAN